ncbi:hypothetical protein, partial [Planococcus sp. 4-30]
WPYLSGALYNLAWVNREAGNLSGAMSRMMERVKVLERLNQIDSVKYSHLLAQAQQEANNFAN